jgi:arabinogalactan oligomer/maltooligosaccharide transport system permease protein
VNDQPLQTGRSDSVESTGGKGSKEGRERVRFRPSFTTGFFVKLLFLAGINAIAIWSLPVMIGQKWVPGIVAVVVITLLIDYVYLRKRTIPLKYLVPGTILAVIFQVIPVVYSAYISFTNYSSGNSLSKAQAIENAERKFSAVPGSERYRLVILGEGDGSGELALYLVDQAGRAFLGTVEGGLEALAPSDVVTDDAGKVTSVDGYVALSIRQLADRQIELASLEIESETGLVRPLTLSEAAVYSRLYSYDEASDTLRNNETGEVYTVEAGSFVDAQGVPLPDVPGWQVFVGFGNYTKIFTSEAIRGPFLRVFVWNYAFALLTVVTTFTLGLGLAVTLNHQTMRGRRLYRSLLLIPYAMPSFMSALIFRGLLNQDFGIINRILGFNINWLNDPWLAKVSVLLLNLWLGFPYMFLISLGALQAIPHELKEAALVDGATSRQAFRRVIFPLLMVTLAPLLISSFAFNFNNFNIIYLFNSGGPPMVGAATPAGHTDILISYTFRLAFEGGRGANYGLANAIAVIIFIMVASISALGFRRTRALEELS